MSTAVNTIQQRCCQDITADVPPDVNTSQQPSEGNRAKRNTRKQRGRDTTVYVTATVKTSQYPSEGDRAEVNTSLYAIEDTRVAVHTSNEQHREVTGEVNTIPCQSGDITAEINTSEQQCPAITADVNSSKKECQGNAVDVTAKVKTSQYPSEDDSAEVNIPQRQSEEVTVRKDTGQQHCGGKTTEVGNRKLQIGKGCGFGAVSKDFENPTSLSNENVFRTSSEAYQFDFSDFEDMSNDGSFALPEFFQSDVCDEYPSLTSKNQYLERKVTSKNALCKNPSLQSVSKKLEIVKKTVKSSSMSAKKLLFQSEDVLKPVMQNREVQSSVSALRSKLSSNSIMSSMKTASEQSKKDSDEIVPDSAESDVIQIILNFCRIFSSTVREI